VEVSNDPAVKFAQLFLVGQKQIAEQILAAVAQSNETITKAHEMVVNLATSVIQHNNDLVKSQQRLTDAIEGFVKQPAATDDPHGGNILGMMMQMKMQELMQNMTEKKAAAKEPKAPNGAKG
jgi:hypothetical protein